MKDGYVISGDDVVSRRGLLGAAAAGVGLLATAANPSSGVASPFSAPVSLPTPRPGARKLPKSFLWGASTAGHQIEGNNVNSDAWVLENVKSSIFPERSGDACDSLHRYPEDIALLRSLGLDSYRFSIEWARIEPVEGVFSLAMLDYYKRVIECCHNAGVRPCVSFNHYVNPAWFAASGGFMRPDGPEIFARYCETAAKHLADGMHIAFTLNEPQAPIIIDVMTKGADRGKLASMERSAAQACGSDRFVTWKTLDPVAGVEPVIRAHKLGFAAIKSVRASLPVGVCLATIDYRGVGENNVAAAVRKEIDGPWMAAAKDAGDFVGVQNYWPLYLDDKGPTTAPKGTEINNVFPFDFDSLNNCVRDTHRATGKPILVTENGLDSPYDARRVLYMTKVLSRLGDVMDQGVPLLGYLHWSLIDNYEWGSFQAKFGLADVDRTTFKRTPKPSGLMLGQFARRGVL